jgi:Tol biopolymer transport system component
MSRIFTATMIFGAALTFVLSAADKAREQTLQRAIDLMESKGDLAKAVPLFEDAARSSDQAVAARALLYLGQAQERQGTEKARATYQRIVKEFSNQTETVAAAQMRLAALGGPGASGAIAKRMLCADCGYFYETDFTSDGRLMVFTDWDSGDLATRNMSTGKVKRLMAKTGTISGGWKDSDAYGESPVLSPDLRQIVYFWQTGGKEPHDQLRIMPNEPGNKARVLIDNPEYDYYEPTAWSADGKSVLLNLRSKRDGTQQLARVSVADGAIKVLKSMGWRTRSVGTHPTFSPDGQYIVYDAMAVNPSKHPPAATDPKDQHIYILTADGSLETEVVKTSGINQYPVWTPDGKHILFISDRSGKSDLWSIGVQNGKVVGSESLVSSEIGKVSGAWMRGNAYYYTNNVRAEYINIAEFAPGGTNQRRIAHATESFIGIYPAWSPDGKSIAFKRRHPGTANDYDLVVHSLETGEERTYLKSFGASNGFAPRWFHDGKAVLDIFGGKVYRIDLKTAEFTEMRSGEPGPPLYPNEKTRYAARNDPKNGDKVPARIVAVDPDTGHEQDVFTLPEPGIASVMPAPDGRPFVVYRLDPKTRTEHLYRLNVDGTGFREIYTIAERDFRNNFTLTKDGRWILFAKQNNDGNNWQLLRIPIEGGAPEPTGVELDHHPWGGLDLSPDGSRLAFTSRKSYDEVWALDNVLSALK